MYDPITLYHIAQAQQREMLTHAQQERRLGKTKETSLLQRLLHGFTTLRLRRSAASGSTMVCCTPCAIK